MAKNLQIDMENGSIIMSKAFAKKASVYDSIEYNKYLKFSCSNLMILK